MENPNFNTPQNTVPVQYAGFWWRFLSYLIDNIIISAVTTLLVLPMLLIMGISVFHLAGYGDGFEPEPAMIFSIVTIAIMIGLFSKLLEWLYFAIMESSRHQGTLGKIALGIKVTDTSGRRISFARATGRYFGKILSNLLLMIGYIMAGFTDRKQALHDMLADCLVIKLPQ
jgi:uncharacterized RDD family membrane protein YckC